MKKGTNTTMADIAREMGVSRTTVSFVLNGHGQEKGISEAMEEKIREAASKLHYRPSLIAQSLKTQKTMTIGLILPNMSVTYGPQITEVIEMGALNKGYQVLLCHHGGDIERLTNILHLMLSRRVDGLIIAAPLDIKYSSVFKEFLESGLPLVFVEHDPDDSRVNYVSSSPEQSVRLAMEHLIEKGHRKIAFLNAISKVVASKKRLQSYKDTLEDIGIEFDPELVFHDDLSQDSTINQKVISEKILNIHNRPTAIIAVNAQRAINAFLAAESLGIQVPKDLSIIAITGQEFTNFHKIRFTRINLPYKAVGETALKVLLEEIQSNKSLLKQRILITPELIQADSTSAAPVL